VARAEAFPTMPPLLEAFGPTIEALVRLPSAGRWLLFVTVNRGGELVTLVLEWNAVVRFRRLGAPLVPEAGERERRLQSASATELQWSCEADVESAAVGWIAGPIAGAILLLSVACCALRRRAAQPAVGGMLSKVRQAIPITATRELVRRGTSASLSSGRPPAEAGPGAGVEIYTECKPPLGDALEGGAPRV